MKFALNLNRRHAQHRSGRKPKPFDTSKLRDQPSVVDSFQSRLCESLESAPPFELSLSEKWTVLHDSLVTAADKTFGRCQRRQPDWRLGTQLDALWRRLAQD